MLTRPDPTPSGSLIGRLLADKYRLLDLIAQGGAAHVYRAEQTSDGRVVAIKILKPSEDSDTDEELRRRFLREAAACARLTHANTVRVFDYGTTADDLRYIAMEYVEGRTLHRVIGEEAPLSPRRVIHVAREIGLSLGEAHSLGLVHRDLKPANVMLMGAADAERIKVLDFGLVKDLKSNTRITRVGVIQGSPSYMSPEQIRGDGIDPRSDLYALGVVMYACLSGRAPFTGTSLPDILALHLRAPPPPFDAAGVHVPPMLTRLVMKCLAKEPGDRFADVDALIHALGLCEEESTVTEPAGAPQVPFADPDTTVLIRSPLAAAVELTEIIGVPAPKVPISGGGPPPVATDRGPPNIEPDPAGMIRVRVARRRRGEG